jgi:hypothetical protein
MPVATYPLVDVLRHALNREALAESRGASSLGLA